MLIEKEVTTVLAGHLSERLLAGEREPSSDDHDMAMAHKVLSTLTTATTAIDETDAYLNWLWVRTRNMFQQPLNWMMVEALATALIEHQELDEETVRNIFHQTRERWMQFRRKASEELE